MTYNHREYMKKYNSEHKKEKKEYDHRRYLECSDKIKEQRRRYLSSEKGQAKYQEYQKRTRDLRIAKIKEWRKQNKEQIRDRVREKKRGIKLKIIEYFGGCCKVCGVEYNGTNASIFDFHHLDPKQKEVNVSTTQKKFEALLPELEKGILLCANCHRLTHNGGI